MKIRRISSWYLVAQALGVIAWWLVLFLWPAWRPMFKAGGAPDAALFGFLVPDLALLAAGSLVAAFGLARDKSWAVGVLWLIAGGMVYAALYCWTLVLLTQGDAIIGALFMTPPLVLNLALAFHWNGGRFVHATHSPKP